jgi:zinc protease
MPSFKSITKLSVKSYARALRPALAVILALACLMATAGAGAQRRSLNESVPAPPPRTPFSDVRRDSLLNGLQVVTLETSEERVRIDLVVKAGAMFDLTGKFGLAALAQETLLAVNPRLKEEIESLQGRIDWGLDWDLTWYRIEVPAANFETSIEILGRLLVVEGIRADAFKSAQQAHLSQLKERNSAPAERAEAAFFAALFGPHPYGHDVAGTESSIASIIQGDISEFTRRFYIANDAVAVIAGPIAHERVMRAFKFVFGGWVKGALVPATFRQPPRVTELKLVKVDAADAERVELRGGVIGLKVTDRDYTVVEVLARVLDSRLKRKAERHGAEHVAALAPPRLLAGPFYFRASVAVDRAEAFSRAATDAFASLAAAPASAEELAAAKASLKSERQARSTAEQVREVEFFNLPRNHPLQAAARIDAVTASDAHRVARQLFAANALTVVVLGPVGDRFKPQM